MNIKSALTGGNPRSLGRTEEVVRSVLRNRSRLDDLFACLFAHDEVVRMRAADALEKVCRERPDWLEPFTDRLLTEVSQINQPSVQWHLAQMLGELPLTEGQKAKAIEVLKRNLETATDWIVLNYSLEVFAEFTKEEVALRQYFIRQLKKHQSSRHKSVAKRATKLLLSLAR